MRGEAAVSAYCGNLNWLIICTTKTKRDRGRYLIDIGMIHPVSQSQCESHTRKASINRKCNKKQIQFLPFHLSSSNVNVWLIYGTFRLHIHIFANDKPQVLPFGSSVLIKTTKLIKILDNLRYVRRSPLAIIVSSSFTIMLGALKFCCVFFFDSSEDDT